MVKIVNNYSLDKLVGKGQYGKVYHAINLQTKIEVAIKVIPITKFIDVAKLTELTKNELQTIKLLQQNINVIKFMEMIKTARNIYLVYEYCQGGTLQDFIVRKREERDTKNRGNRHQLHLHRSSSMGYQGRVPSGLIMAEKDALIIWKQLINAFKSLSQYNIMHRDVKPNNIFFKSGHLKLADFGFCKMLKTSDDLTQTSLGSPMYMAPQVLNGDVYGSKADVWSAAIVLYEMLFGICPISDCSIKDLLEIYNKSNNYSINDLIPIPVDTLTPTCEMMMMKMLQRDQFRRISWQDYFYEYNITENGCIIRREKDFEYDLMRLMKKSSSINVSSNHSSKSSKLKYDWNNLVDMKSSVVSQQLEETNQQQSFNRTNSVKKLDLDEIYQLRKKIKQFELQHHKMVLLSEIFETVANAQENYQYSEEICYIIAYNIEAILTNTLKLLHNYQTQNKQMLENNSSEFNTLKRINVVFINQRESVITKLRQVRVLIVKSIQPEGGIPAVIRYSNNNISVAKTIAKSYVQQFKKNCPQIIDFHINTVENKNNQKRNKQQNAQFLLKVLWGALALTKSGKQLEAKILNLQKCQAPIQIHKLLNQLIVGMTCEVF